MKNTRLIPVALAIFSIGSLAHSGETNAVSNSRQAQLAERAIWQAKADNWYRSRTDIQWGETTNGLKWPKGGRWHLKTFLRSKSPARIN